MRFSVTKFDGIGVTADGMQLVVRLQAEPRPDAQGNAPIQAIDLAMTAADTTEFFNDVLRGALQLAVARPAPDAISVTDELTQPIGVSDVRAGFGPSGEARLMLKFGRLRLEAVLSKSQATDLVRQLQQMPPTVPAPKGLQ